MQGQLPTVVALHRVLLELSAAERLLESVPDWMQELHEEHSQEKEAIDELQAAVEAAERERRLAEGEIQDLETRIKRYQEQIGQVSTQREYGALLREIDMVKAGIKELEERALAAMSQQEEARAELGERTAAFQGLDERYQAELARWEEEKPEVRARVERLRAEMEELRERLPKPVLGLFERISARFQETAVAPLKKVERPGASAAVWHCSGCNYRVRPQVVSEVQANGVLVQCDSCKRILGPPEEG